MKKIYALVNYSTGEVYNCEGEGVTCQGLYRRALSCRRNAIYCESVQDYIRLLRVEGYAPADILNGVIIQEWRGGINPPVDDMGLSPAACRPLKMRGCKTAEDVVIMVRSCAVWTYIPRRDLLDLARILREYDETAARVIINRLNKERRAQR